MSKKARQAAKLKSNPRRVAGTRETLGRMPITFSEFEKLRPNSLTKIPALS